VSSHQPPCNHGRRITTSVTSTSTEDVLKHAYQPPVGSYEPTRQHMTRYDASSDIEYQRTDEDTSIRHVSSPCLPHPTSGHRITMSTTVTSAMDASKHIHYLSPRLYELTDQRSRCLDISPDGDHREDTQDMSLQHVPSSYLCPPTYGRRITTSVTSTSAADVSSGVDYHRDSEEMSLRRASSSYQPSLTHGRHIMTSVTSTSTKDVSRRVNSVSDGSYGSTHPNLRHSNVPLDVDQQATSIRRVSLTSDGSHKSDVQDDWEERINLVCMEYGMTKPHCQAQYCERAIKIVDEFANNNLLKLVKGSSRYYDTIVKMFTRLAQKYRQNRDSKRLGFPIPEIMWTPGCSVAHTGGATEVLLPTHITSGCHDTTSVVFLLLVDMLYGHATPSDCERHILTSATTAWPTADTLNCVRNLSAGCGSTYSDVMCLNDDGMSLRHPSLSHCHQITPEHHISTFTTMSTADRLSCVCKLPAPYGPTHPFLMHSHASLGADHCRDSKDMSCGHVPSSFHSAPIVECRTSTPIPGTEEVMRMMTNIMIRQCVTNIERHRSFIKDALKSMQGEWSQRTIVLAFEHLDKLIKEYKAVLKTKRLQLAVTYSQKFKENQISLSKSESKNDLVSLPQSLETAAKSSKIVRRRNVENFEHSRFVARPIVGLPHESSTLLASEHHSESALSWRSHRAPTLGSWWSHCAPTLGSWWSHCAPTLGSWRSQHAPAIRGSNGQGEHMSTNSPSDTISLWCRNAAENVNSPISLEEI
jgi:hypothetical protein